MTPVITYDACHDKELNPKQHNHLTVKTRIKKGERKILTPKNSQKTELANIQQDLEAQCRKCAPISPLQCLDRCKVWKLKNELRTLKETMNKPNFKKELLNVLKNQTRIDILKSITRNRISVNKLQQELKKTGHSLSQETINEEYLQPLMTVGLAIKNSEEYCATNFGGKLTQILGDNQKIVNLLPAHSECHEESLITELSKGSKTFEEIEKFVPASAVSRVITRLKKAGLLETPDDRDYIFFFRSKRDSTKETLAITEEKVYQTIPDQGISANKLAQATGISTRRIYKHLRTLKGKKLVFTRKAPKLYNLTDSGQKLADILQGLTVLVDETWSSSKQFASLQPNS
jgi:DNA-binding HxlR family transcriptional regulator